ncbi:MAG: SUMF1/EgtB/PvdO family nonheme iron enzyme [bacterium]|nr:SUMF1/EgtB/PvdO family nonheme iron enzyme [bacterium]
MASSTGSAEETLFDEYLEALLHGEPEDPSVFCRRRSAGPEVEARLEGLFRLLGSEGTPSARAPSDLDAGLAADADLPFERLGDFRLIRKLGEGGMGVVFLAQDVVLGRLVALKIVRPEYVGSATVAARFEREARVVSGLRHPGIVTVLGVGTDKSVRYIAMELVPGHSLDEVFARAKAEGKPVEVLRLVRWVKEIAQALACAHDEGVIHRDVKPSNVRVSPDDRAHLLDFGLARRIGSQSLTLTHSFAGSPSYAAPEQLSHRRTELGELVDVYSLGVTLYEGLTGRAPFEGDTVERILHQVLTREAPSPRGLGFDVPRDVDVIVMKAMEKDPKRRYASARAFAADLGAVLELRPITARPSGVGTRAYKWAYRNRLASAILLTVVLAGLVSMAIVVQQASARRQANRREAVNLLARARQQIEAYRVGRVKVEDLRWRTSEISSDLTKRWLAPSEYRDLHAASRVVEDHDRDRELAYIEVLELLGKAERIDKETPGARELRAELYYEKWLDVRDEPDRQLQRYYRDLVIEHDVSGEWTVKVDGRATLEIRSEPADAEVFLYRYYGVQSPDSGPGVRAVPGPVASNAWPTPLGEVVLRVLRDGGELGRSDHVLTVAGHPVGGSVLVVGGSSAVEPMARLVSIDGEPVHDLYGARTAELGTGAQRRFEFRGPGGEPTVVEGESIRALGIELCTPVEAVRRGGVDVEILRGSERRAVHLTQGVETRATAAPLLVLESCREGLTPIDVEYRDPGWYAAVLKKDGYETQRLSFHIDHACEHYSVGLVLQPRLLPEQTSPVGFLHVPISAFDWIDGEDFWIQEREVTNADYLEFLNDPQRLAVVGPDAEVRHVPRGDWARSSDGRFRLPDGAGGDFPVLGISWLDAQAYVRWRNERSEADDVRQRGFRYALPTRIEWAIAAYGGDSREFAFGQSFSPKWVKSRFARTEPRPESVLSFPIDESPYGAFDMAGSAAEWCADRLEPNGVERVQSGGSWAHFEPTDFRNATVRGFPPDATGESFGFRLVLHRL